jgi:hypothetical protein
MMMMMLLVLLLLLLMTMMTARRTAPIATQVLSNHAKQSKQRASNIRWWNKPVVRGRAGVGVGDMTRQPNRPERLIAASL